MSDHLIEEIHASIQKGLYYLFGDQLGEWELTPPKKIRLHRTSPLSSKQVRVQLLYIGEEKEIILAAILDLVNTCQAALRICGRCKQPFVRTHKQRFCSEKCAQAVSSGPAPSPSKAEAAVSVRVKSPARNAAKAIQWRGPGRAGRAVIIGSSSAMALPVSP